jgi:protein-S-isoprenylcysteine O-methyltransferase Ste14
MGIIDHIIGLVESRLELFKIEAKEEASHVIARILVMILLGLFLFFTWFFVALALGLWLNVLFESQYLGVLAAGIIHLLLFIIIFLNRDAPRLKRMIKTLLDSVFETKD